METAIIWISSGILVIQSHLHNTDLSGALFILNRSHSWSPFLNTQWRMHLNLRRLYTARGFNSKLPRQTQGQILLPQSLVCAINDGRRYLIFQSVLKQMSRKICLPKIKASWWVLCI